METSHLSLLPLEYITAAVFTKLFPVLKAGIFIHFIPLFTCSVDDSLFLPSKGKEVKLPPAYTFFNACAVSHGQAGSQI